MMIDNDLQLTDKQIKSAQTLFEKHLPNWRLANAAFSVLKGATVEQKKLFETEAGCLAIAAAVDNLYSTRALSNSAGLETIAGLIFSEKDKIREASNSRNRKLIDDLSYRARKNQNETSGMGPRSFFSKFFYFFVSEDHYPIYDTLAIKALKWHKFAVSKEQCYSKYCETIDQILSKHKFRVGQLDRYLWLKGKWIEWDQKKANENGNKNNEVIKLFAEAKGKQIKLLKEMTNNAYNGGKRSS